MNHWQDLPCREFVPAGLSRESHCDPSAVFHCRRDSLGESSRVPALLAPPNFRRVAAYICGWAYVVGNITITLAVQFGTTLFFVACVNVFKTEDGEDIWNASSYQVFLTFLAITLLCNAISTFGNRWLHLLDVSLRALGSPRLAKPY